MLNTYITVTVGSGKAVHWGTDGGTRCGAAHRNGFFTAPRETEQAVTCKRCIRLMAADVETAHVEALREDSDREFYPGAFESEAVERRTEALAKLDGKSEPVSADVQAATTWVSDKGAIVIVTRVQAAHGARVSFRRIGGIEVGGIETGTLPLRMFLESFRPTKVTTHHTPSGAANALLDLGFGMGAIGAMMDRARRAGWARLVDRDLNMEAHLGLSATTEVVTLAVAKPASPERPGTSEEWKAYAERLKASRDTAEAEVLQLVRDIVALADKWERASQLNGTPEDSWVAIRKIARAVAPKRG